MGKIMIKTQEELSGVMNDHETRLETVTTKSAEIEESTKAAIEAMQKTMEEKDVEHKQESEQLLEKIKSLTLLATAKGSWKEKDTPQAICYKVGAFVQAISEARHGSAIGKAVLGDMGSRFIKEDLEAKESVILGKELREKGGLSGSPLTGDDSVGSYNGSYTLPVEYRAELFRIAIDASALMGRVRSFPVPAITSYAPTTTDALAFTKVTNQNTDKTEDNITFGQQTLTTEIYAAYIAIVEEFFEDTLINIGELVRDMFGEAWGLKFDTLCMEDSTYGVINTTNVVETTMSAGDIEFASLTWEYLHDMIASLTTRAKRQGNVFVMHPTIWDIIRTAKNADGDYYIGPVTAGMPLMAWGYPVVLTDGMPDSTDSAADTTFVAFGNPVRILNGVRVPFEFKIYDQTQSAMESGQIFLRCRTRQAFVLSNPTAWTMLTTAAS